MYAAASTRQTALLLVSAAPLITPYVAKLRKPLYAFACGFGGLMTELDSSVLGWAASFLFIGLALNGELLIDLLISLVQDLIMGLVSGVWVPLRFYFLVVLNAPAPPPRVDLAALFARSAATQLAVLRGVLLVTAAAHVCGVCFMIRSLVASLHARPARDGDGRKTEGPLTPDFLLDSLLDDDTREHRARCATHIQACWVARKARKAASAMAVRELTFGLPLEHIEFDVFGLAYSASKTVRLAPGGAALHVHAVRGLSTLWMTPSSLTFAVDGTESLRVFACTTRSLSTIATLDEKRLFTIQDTQKSVLLKSTSEHAATRARALLHAALRTKSVMIKRERDGVIAALKERIQHADDEAKHALD